MGSLYNLFIGHAKIRKACGHFQRRKNTIAIRVNGIEYVQGLVAHGDGAGYWCWRRSVKPSPGGKIWATPLQTNLFYCTLLAESTTGSPVQKQCNSFLGTMPRQTKITPAEEAIYKADFAKFDTNGNGALDGDEMAAMAKFQLGSDASDDKVLSITLDTRC